MNKIIHALEMEEDDDFDDADDNIHLLSSNGNGHSMNGGGGNNKKKSVGFGSSTNSSTRDALNRQQQRLAVKQSSSGTSSGTKNKLSISSIIIGTLFVLIILYGIIYRETGADLEPSPDTFTFDDDDPTAISDNNENHQRSNNNNDNDDNAVKTEPVTLIDTKNDDAEDTIKKITKTDDADKPITTETIIDDNIPPTASSQESSVSDFDPGTNSNGDEPTTKVTSDNESSEDIDTSMSSGRKGFMYSELSQITPDPDHVPIDDETKKNLTEIWGKWKFYDGDETERPLEDYCGQYPNRDIPGDMFPDGAWQMDAVYVNHIINDASDLIVRAKEAIFTEYGHGKPIPPEQLSVRLQMFQWYRLKTLDEAPEKYAKSGGRGNGGWTTEKGWDGLVRRLLHAIMTNDDFTVVLGGHSAAAGHGNHFHQSYMMQFHKIMAPIFARLGVKLNTRNLSQGGLGTLQNALGMKSLYGSAIDILLWDSGMTETDITHVDLFLRQGLLSGSKVPILWGGRWPVLKYLYDSAEADVGEYGSGMDGIEAIQNSTHALTIPYAARYMKCAHGQQDICDNQPKFCATCWLGTSDTSFKKDDHFWKIDPKPGSQVSWHPGFRSHQLQGRVLAFTLLDALQEAVQIFSDHTMGGPPLDEDWWHMTDYYNNIREKLLKLSDSGECPKIAKDLPKRVCSVALEARSLYTPRADPIVTSLTEIIQPNPEDGYVPKNTEKMEYDGPELHNKCYDVPEGSVDVLAIVSNRRHRSLLHYVNINNTRNAFGFSNHSEFSDAGNVEADELDNKHLYTNERRKLGDDIIPGKGWIVVGEPPGNCDGSYDAICGRAKWQACPAIGHHDSRGVVQGDEYAGWLVFNLPQVKDGIIILKVVTWVDANANWKTKEWKSVNNEKGRKLIGVDDEYEQRLQNNVRRISKNRRLGNDVKNYPDATIFDFAIDGVVKSFTKSELIKAIKKPQRVTEFITLLDDSQFNPKTNVQVAIRLRNCGRSCPIGVSHIYWA